MPSELERDLLLLSQATLGRDLARTEDPAVLLRHLEAGRDDLVVAFDRAPGARSTIVLRGLREGRVLFYDPEGRPTEIPGALAEPGDGGPRCSLPRESLQALFEGAGAVGYLPLPPEGP